MVYQTVMNSSRSRYRATRRQWTTSGKAPLPPVGETRRRSAAHGPEAVVENASAKSATKCSDGLGNHVEDRVQPGRNVSRPASVKRYTRASPSGMHEREERTRPP